MDNQLDKRLDKLSLPVTLKPEYNGAMKLIDLIEKPLWTYTGKRARDTLIPDLVSLTVDQFVIFDAKYYNAQLEIDVEPKRQPGIESVTKQYLYQLAYQKFIKDHGFSSVRNCFLLPTEGGEIVNRGEVSMDMLNKLGLQNIQVRYLPTKMAYELYLSRRKMDLSFLKL